MPEPITQKVEMEVEALKDRPRPDITPKEVAIRYQMPCGAGPLHAQDVAPHAKECVICRDQIDPVLSALGG